MIGGAIAMTLLLLFNSTLLVALARTANDDMVRALRWTVAANLLTIVIMIVMLVKELAA